MGRGAKVTIENNSSQPVKIDYTDIKNMHENGNWGSDFRPITGKLSRRKKFGPQYIEQDRGVLGNNGRFKANIHTEHEREPVSLSFFTDGTIFTFDHWNVEKDRVEGKEILANTKIAKDEEDKIDKIIITIRDVTNGW